MKNRNLDTILAFGLNNKALILLVIIFILSVIVTDGRTIIPFNFLSLMRQLSVHAVIAVGFTVLLSSGGIDLSIGEIISLSGVVYAFASLVFPLPVAIMFGVLVGLGCGLINGFVTRYFNLPGFVLTLGTALIYQGVIFILTGGRAVGQLSDAAKWFGQGRVAGIPVPFIIAILVTVTIYILVNKTLYGRHLLATGGNPNAAMVSGIKIDVVRVAAYAIAGLSAGIGGMMLTGRVGSAGAMAGDGILMDCIAAVVIGGTPMSGGKAKVVGTLFGVSLIVVINNMLNLMGISSYYQWVARGSIIVIAIIVDSYSEKFMQSQRTKAAAKQE